LPIRIYALAKELKLDSKSLVDICKKAGVTGKGSALASLSDEEVETIKNFLSKGKAGGASAGPPAAGAGRAAPRKSASGAPESIRREDYIAPGAAGKGKVPVLGTKRPKAEKPSKTEKPSKAEGPGKAAEPSKEAEPTGPAEVERPTGPQVEGPPGQAAEPSKPEPPAEAPPKPVEPKRPLQPGPSTESGKPAEIPSKTSKAAKPAAKSGGKPEKTGPAIKLAPMPTAQAPPPTAKSQEPAPQKPDLKLPADAIRASKAGGKPLSEHLRKHEAKRKAEQAKKRGGPAEAEGEPSATPSTPARDRRRSKTAAPAEEEKAGRKPALGGREHRQLNRKRAAARRRRDDDDETATPARRRATRLRRTGSNTAAPRKGKVVVETPCTVKSFSEAIGVPVRTVLGRLMSLGTGANITNMMAELDPDLVDLLADDLGVEVEIRQQVALEDRVLSDLDGEDEDPAQLKPRAPVITFLGHVDHGKTSLLDRIIETDVVSGEKGGITQHIRAYQIQKDGRAISFVDTPGHEAFTEMRARGANCTDIAVLVIAADDGIMPQTEEAISHAQAAGVPMIVALNKIDLPGVDVQRTFEQLAANGLLPSEWGGDLEVIKTSATTGEGIDELLETLLTVAELHEYKANPNRPSVGICLEAELHEGRGVVAKMLVQKGTLKVGDVIVCGEAHGRVKAMYDTLQPRKRHKKAGPSVPVNLTGLDAAPSAGSRFYALGDISQAREIAQQRAALARQETLGMGRQHVTLENLFDRLGEQEIQTLNIILRADVRGSIEAIRKELTKLEHPEVQVKILQAMVGGVTEADVHLADASDAIIIGFSVVPDEGARTLAERKGVQIRRYDIIYQVTEDLKAALEGMLRPERREQELGRALVQRTFQISRLGTVAGCRVLNGNIHRDSRVRVVRESRVIGDYPLDSLKREKDDAREVREGLECGMKLAGFNDLKEGDLLEAYKIEEVARTF
jgi:translation initiation factor IF-2